MANAKQKIPDPVIVLNENYQVTLDPRCLILRKKITSEDKELSKEEIKTGEKILGYFSTWECIGAYLIKDMAREKAKSKKDELVQINEFIEIIKNCKEEICNIFSNIDEYTKVNK